MTKTTELFNAVAFIPYFVSSLSDSGEERKMAPKEEYCEGKKRRDVLGRGASASLAVVRLCTLPF